MPLAGPRECPYLQLLACQGRRQPIWEREGRGPGPLARWGLCRGRRQEGSTLQAEWGIGLDRSQIRPSKQTTLTGDRASDMLSPLTWVRPSKITEGRGLYFPELKNLHSCSVTGQAGSAAEGDWPGTLHRLSPHPHSHTHTHTYTHTHTHTHTRTHTEASCQSSQNLLFWGDCCSAPDFPSLWELCSISGELLTLSVLFSQRLL